MRICGDYLNYLEVLGFETLQVTTDRVQAPP